MKEEEVELEVRCRSTYSRRVVERDERKKERNRTRRRRKGSMKNECKGMRDNI